MIIYNVTVKVEPHIAEAWLHWLRTEHAPEMIATHCFTEYRIVKLLDVEEYDGHTYAVQYFAPDLDAYKHYLKQHNAALQKKTADKWSGQLVSFSTIMEVL
ncbi:MAG: DUF4286 family protein [Flavisolibacter sp.]|nr:DUF4286 family protein [Flavisolibacter sp.]MBD0375914.1 DUF4286 family protein [Flavisolibacter sp.]